MRPPDTQSRFVPSLLDRLTAAVNDPSGADRRRGYTLADLTESVRRDLEELLNTRQTSQDVPEALERARQSVLGYGLPEFTSLNAVTVDQLEVVARMVEETVARYEPRLRDVQVALLPNDGEDLRAVRCRIEARLALDPSPDVTYDSVLELTTGRYTVQRKGS